MCSTGIVTIQFAMPANPPDIKMYFKLSIFNPSFSYNYNKLKNIISESKFSLEYLKTLKNRFYPSHTPN